METDIIDLSPEEAIAVLPDRDIIHCFAGALGADWARESVVEEIKNAQRIAWTPNIFGHELALEAGEKSGWHNRSVLRFDVKNPANTI